MNKKEIRKLVKLKGKKFAALWNAIKGREAYREQKRRLISRKGASYLDRLNAILFEIQDDIDYAKRKDKAHVIDDKQHNELHNLLVLLDHFRSKPLAEQRFILDQLKVENEIFLTDL